MTPEERSKVLDVIATADHGCGECIRNLLDNLVRVLPDHEWRAEFVMGVKAKTPRRELEVFEAAVAERSARVDALDPAEDHA